MNKSVYRLSIWISLLSALAVIAWAQAPAQQAATNENASQAPVTFRCRLDYLLMKNPPPNLPNELTDRNTIDLSLRNNDSAKTIQQLEYQIYTTDKQSGVEVDHIRRVDKTEIKPGQVKERRGLLWKPDSIIKACDPPSKCRIKLRIVRIKYDDGSEWPGKIEAEKDDTGKKK